MKYLEYTPLDRINDFLSHVNFGERTIKGCLEAYSCKHTGTDKKLSFSLENEILDYLGKSSDSDSSSPAEYLSCRSSRKMLVYLILTLYHMYPNYDFSDRKVHGIFEAASSGQMNINPYGWTADGSERTSYPAQFRSVCVTVPALREYQFKPILSDNYYGLNHLWFELDHAQTNNLMSLLSSLAVALSTSAPQKTAKWRTLFQSIPSPQRGEENEGFDPPVSNLYFAHSYKSNGNLDTSDMATCFSGNNQISETYLDKRELWRKMRRTLYT